MEPSEVPLVAMLPCENCSYENPSDRKFCSQCSFPIAGTAEEKSSFWLSVSRRKRLLSDAHDKIKSAKTVIYVLAGLFFVFGLIAGFGMDDFLTMIINIVMSLVYLILAAWSSRNPFGAILTAFIIYITVQLINFIVEPTTLFQGIIIKAIVVVALIKGIRSAQEARRYMSELEKVKSA